MSDTLPASTVDTSTVVIANQDDATLSVLKQQAAAGNVDAINALAGLEAAVVKISMEAAIKAAAPVATIPAATVVAGAVPATPESPAVSFASADLNAAQPGINAVVAAAGTTPENATLAGAGAVTVPSKKEHEGNGHRPHTFHKKGHTDHAAKPPAGSLQL